MADAVENNKISNKVVMGIILSGWVVSLLLVLSIIGVSVYLLVAFPAVELSDTLKQWAGISIGFLFGNFFALVRDYLIQDKGK